MRDERTLRDLLLVGLEALDAAQGSVLLADERHEFLTFAVTASRGALARHEQEFAPLTGRKIAWGEGVTGRAALTARTQKSDGGHETGRMRIVGDGAPSAVLAVPMLDVRGEVLGVVTAVSFDRIREFAPEACRLYERVAAIAAALVGQEGALT